MAAFLEARRLGAWGIEFDVRFSSDGAPVICHDSEMRRCFGRQGLVSETRAADMPPDMCRLEEVMGLSGLHFMIEIKEPLTRAQLETLETRLKDLSPIDNYHLLALHPDLVRVTSRLPARAWILVGELNSRRMIRESLRRGLGGVAGHYLLMTSEIVQRLHSSGQMAGTGFVSSRNVLNRECARGVDWVFTNKLTCRERI